MELEDMQKAVRDAQYVINRADDLVATMANLIRGRLKKGNVSGWILGELKRELRNYNIHTGSWKEQ